MVSSPTVRHPVTLAKEAMTLDHVSGGRFSLGLGAGGAGFDAEVFGGHALTRSQRADRLGEFVEAIDQLLRQVRGPVRPCRAGSDPRTRWRV
jgi:alkanesulfonate monooxygenase SsuD/methylene tetrahydromethanopterin reductase-like flavin-dependent oxidoreductase (luciferase family)